MPVSPSTTAAQHSLLPIEPPASQRNARPAQKKSVDRKISALIHRMADWLARKYFRKKACSARASSGPFAPPYCEIPNSDSTAMPIISTRTGFHVHPSHAKAGTAAIRMPRS